MEYKIVRYLQSATLRGLTAFYALVLLGAGGACKKSPAVKPVLTPLQVYVNSDTSLTLFHRMILQANESVLLGNDSVTVLIPDNAAFRSVGYTDKIIDSLSASAADNMIRYHFINSRAVPAVGPYTGFPGKTGYRVYGMKDSVQLFWFNGIRVKGSSAPVGNALVYKLATPLQGPSDSLNHLLAADSSLTFLAEAFRRTNLYYKSLLSGNYTILAPSNSAFMNAGYGSSGAIDNADSTKLVNLLKYHVVKGFYFTNTLMSVSSVPTLSGGAIAVSSQNGVIQFTGTGGPVTARLIKGNQTAGDSIIVHRIDQVLKQ